MSSLRERREDIPYLTAAFVREFAARFGKPIEGVSSGAEQMLMNGAWLGNVRELRNVLERACMLADGRTLSERDLGAAMPAVPDQPPPTPPGPAPSHHGLDRVEREHIVRVLADVKGNKQAAARRLGISRRTLYRRLERHGLMQSLPS
jgi:DNA-binding NtrC family response regulator